MSYNIPRITPTPNNSDAIKNIFNQDNYNQRNINGSNTNTFIQNGGNIIDNKKSRPLSTQNIYIYTNNNELAPQVINPIVYESKFNDLEAKLITLEQANQILLNRLNDNERNFEVQIKELQLRAAEERENRFKSDKTISIINDQNNLSSNDLKLKINLLQETLEKGELSNDQIRKHQLENINNMINQLTDRIQESVKLEVEARYKADLENQTYSNGITDKFNMDIMNLKKEFEEILNSNKIEIQNVSKECSERTHNVSKYIDQQIQEAVFGKSSSQENLKNFVNKLTDQIKNNLISQNNQNQIFENRLNGMENYMRQMREELYSFIAEVERRLVSRMKDVKLYTEVNIQKNNEHVFNYLKDLSTKTDNNMQFLAGQIIDTRMRINEKFEVMENSNREHFRSLISDLESVCNRIYKYEALLKDYDLDYKTLNVQIQKDLANLRAEFGVHTVNERMIHTIENDMMQTQINDLINGVNQLNKNLNDAIEDVKKTAQNNFNVLNNNINKVNDDLNVANEKNLNMFEDFEKTNQNIEVAQIMNEMVTKVEENYLLEQMQKRKNVENEHTTKIMTIFTKIDENKDNIDKLKTDHENKLQELNNQYTQLFTNFETNENNMNKNFKNIQKQQNERDIKNLVEQTMEKMVSNVEMIIERENITKQNDKKLSKSIKKIEDKLNEFSTTNNNQITEINNSIKKIKKDTKNQIKNLGVNEIEISNTMNQMLNNIEFEHIYDLLKSGNLFSKKEKSEDKKESFDEKYSEIIENKIKKALEDVKNDNENIWKNIVKSTEKLNAPADIDKIIKDVPPVVIPINESYKRILELDYFEDSNPVPLVPDLNEQLKQVLKNIADNSRNDSKNSTLINNNKINTKSRTNKNENAEVI